MRTLEQEPYPELRAVNGERLAVTFTVGVLFMTSLGCSSSQSASHQCASNGPTFSVHYVEESGNCGAIADAVYYTPSDGGAIAQCSSAKQQSCTAQDSGCMTSDVYCMVFGGTPTLSGNTASWTETHSCMGSAGSCMSTYQVTATEQ